MYLIGSRPNPSELSIRSSTLNIKHHILGQIFISLAFQWEALYLRLKITGKMAFLRGGLKISITSIRKEATLSDSFSHVFKSKLLLHVENRGNDCASVAVIW